MSDDNPCPSGSTKAPAEDSTGGKEAPQGSVRCQNCGTPLEGEYCYVCGQRHLPYLRLRDLGRYYLERVLDIGDLGDGLRRTLLDGMRSPGCLARQFVDGKRKRIVHPIGYFLLAATLLFLTYSFFQAEWVQSFAGFARVQWEAMGLPPGEMFSEGSVPRQVFGASSVEAFAQDAFEYMQIQTYLGALTCLIGAGLLHGLFSGPSYADLVVFELYTTAQACLLQVVVVLVLMMWLPAALLASGPAVLIGMHLVAGPGFFGRTWNGWMYPPLAIAVALVLQMGGLMVVGAAYGLLV